MGNYIVKGQLIAITGSIHTRAYEKADQTTAYVTEVNVDQIQSLERREKIETEESIKAEWKKEWDEKSPSLKGLAKDKLKKDLEAKYQPRIDALVSKALASQEDTPPWDK